MKIATNQNRAEQLARLKAARAQAPAPTTPAEPQEAVTLGSAQPKEVSKTLAASRSHKTSKAAYASLAAMGVGAALLGATAAAGIVAATGVVGTLAMAVGVGASLVGGYAAADLVSAGAHFGLDNYPEPSSKGMGKVADDFQYHHHNPHSVFRRSFLDNCHLTGRVAGPVALGLGIAVGSPLLAAGALAFTGGVYLLQGSHMLAHDTRPSKLSKVLQKFHITQSKKNHNAHHTRPWESNYAIVNGMTNPLLEKTNFWRKAEKAIFKITGREPKSWRHEPTRQFALGHINQEEYKASFKSGLPDFQAKADVFLQGYLERNPDRDRQSGKEI